MAGADGQRFVVPLTDQLRSVVLGARRPRRRSVASRLPPRDIQARLRAGASVDEVAAEAGVERDWVERFAGPVMAERQAALVRAQRLRYQAPRRGLSLEPLGDAVARNVRAKGVQLEDDELAEGWAARQEDGTRWVVSFDYILHRRTVTAEWSVDLAAGTVTPLNRTATSLGYVAPGGQSAAGDEEAALALGDEPAGGDGGDASEGEVAEGEVVEGEVAGADDAGAGGGQLGLPGVDE